MATDRLHGPRGERMPFITLRVLTKDRCVRTRHPEVDRRPPKALWVVHRSACEFAPGCVPLTDLVAKVGEMGVLGRIKAGRIARCKTCHPTLVERVPG